MTGEVLNQNTGDDLCQIQDTMYSNIQHFQSRYAWRYHDKELGPRTAKLAQLRVKIMKHEIG